MKFSNYMASNCSSAHRSRRRRNRFSLRLDLPLLVAAMMLLSNTPETTTVANALQSQINASMEFRNEAVARTTEMPVLRNQYAVLQEVKIYPESKFELTKSSLTQSLEETIRDSVKNEIEGEQNTVILQAFRDIPEPDIRSDYNGKIVSADATASSLSASSSLSFSEKYQHETSKQRGAESPAVHEKDNVTTAAVDLKEEMPETFNKYMTKHDFKGVHAAVENIDRIPPSKLQSSDGDQETVREIRNLETDLGQDLNSLTSDRDDTDIEKEIAIGKSNFEIDKDLPTAEKFDQQELDATDGTSSRILKESNSTAAEKFTHTPEEIFENANSSMDSNRVEEDNDLEVVTTISEPHVEQLNNIASSAELKSDTTAALDNEGLSIVWDESLTATDPAIVGLADKELQHLQSFVSTQDEVIVVPPKDVEHVVIKKQGVDSSPVEVDSTIEETGEEKALAETTPYSIILRPVGFHSSNNVSRLEGTTAVNGGNVENTDTRFPQPQPQTTTDLPLTSPTELATTEDQTELGLEPGAYSGAETISSKGSRSINTEHSTVDNAAATLFETYDPSDAGQTLNDKLAADSSSNIDKALPASRINGVSIKHSTIVVLTCSITALLFVVVSLAAFLISFQRQHGTLDIEMQEQRCGKDNDDELDVDIDAETCTKLLEVELPPPPTDLIAAETDECL